MGWKCLARSRMASIWPRSSSSIPNSPSGMACSGGFSVYLFHQQHLFHSVDLLELYLDDFDVGSLHGAADVARLDGQFTVAAIDQYEQLHARRTPVLEQAV